MKNQTKKLICIFIITIFALNIISQNCIVNGTNDNIETIEEPTSYETVLKALQEVAYSYYMRGRYIQYNATKAPSRIPYPPEEATIQNTHYTHCSAFTKSVYYELLGIMIPRGVNALIEYGKNFLGESEVIGYGYRTKNKETNEDEFKMSFYEPSAENNLRIVTNPSVEDIIPYLQIRRYTYIYRTYDDGI